MKFLVDMPLSPELAQWLRAEGHPAVHANELSMNRSPDAEILQAVSSRWLIITADLDFPRLLAKLGSTGPGLILLRGANYSEAQSRDCVRRDRLLTRRIYDHTRRTAAWKRWLIP